MLVHPFIRLPTDEPFWISRDDFVAYFDQDDFYYHRKVKSVEAAYRKDWFRVDKGITKFEIPVVTFVGAKTQFIQGRHRTAVLISHIPELPIALVSARLSLEELRVRFEIPKRPLAISLPIELPDLPFLP